MLAIWNYQRSKPTQVFEWGTDTIIKAKFNPSEHNLICATALDRSIQIFDIRGQTAINKITLPNKSTCLAWNPTEPINFTVGSDDSNCYTFDMRKVDRAKLIHKDHIQAVMDLDFAPTGREFVTGSFDKTIRIFNFDAGTSKEVYHTKRMQNIFAVQYSMDSQYIFSGSDDMNIRIWKSNASAPLGIVKKREQQAINYREKLKETFGHLKEIKRIKNHRHLPKYILNAKVRRHEKREGKIRRMENMQVNNRNDFQIPTAERQKKVENIEWFYSD